MTKCSLVSSSPSLNVINDAIIQQDLFEDKFGFPMETKLSDKVAQLPYAFYMQVLNKAIKYAPTHAVTLTFRPEHSDAQLVDQQVHKFLMHINSKCYSKRWTKIGAEICGFGFIEKTRYGFENHIHMMLRLNSDNIKGYETVSNSEWFHDEFRMVCLCAQSAKVRQIYDVVGWLDYIMKKRPDKFAGTYFEFARNLR